MRHGLIVGNKGKRISLYLMITRCTGHYGMVEGALIASGVDMIAAICRGRA